MENHNHLRDAVTSIYEKWHNSWFKRFLEWTTIGTSLKLDILDPVFIFNFIEAYLSSFWLIQWLIRLMIDKKTHSIDFSNIIRCAELLEQNKILSSENLTIIVEFKNPHEVAKTIEFLSDKNLLDKTTFTCITKFGTAHQWMNVLETLHNAHLLSTQQIETIAKFNYIEEWNRGITYLSNAKLLNSDNLYYFDTEISDTVNPELFAQVLNFLYKNFKITEWRFLEYRTLFTKALCYLQKNYLLTYDAFLQLMENIDYIRNLSKILENYDKVNLLYHSSFSNALEFSSDNNFQKYLVTLKTRNLNDHYRECISAFVDYDVLETVVNLLRPVVDDFEKLVNIYESFLSDLHYVEKSLIALSSLGLLNKNYFDKIYEKDYWKIFQIISLLADAHLFDETKLKYLISTKKDFYRVNQILSILSKTTPSLLTNDNYEIILGLKHRENIFFNFQALLECNLLDSETFSVFKSVEELYGNSITALHHSHLLSKNNLYKILKFPDSYHLTKMLTHLSNAKILDQDTFAFLLNPENKIMISSEVINIFGDYLSVYRTLKYSEWIQCLDASKSTYPLQEIQRIMHKLYYKNNIQKRTFHPSVSESAIKLRACYSKGIYSKQLILETIQNSIHQLSQENIAYSACQRAVQNISINGNMFVDEASKVSLLDLLIYCWKAIHDDSKRLVRLSEAKALFFKALYEIQRNCDINDPNQDFSVSDTPICLSSQFTKLMDSLYSIHQLVDICVVTPELASHKLPVIIKNEAFKYLKKIASPNTVDDYQMVKKVFTTLKSLGVQSIWSNIRETVSHSLFEEYGEAFNQDIQDSNFQKLISSGIAIDLESLRDIEQQLQSSNGYRLSNKNKISNSPNNLWSQIERKNENLNQNVYLAR